MSKTLAVSCNPNYQNSQHCLGVLHSQLRTYHSHCIICILFIPAKVSYGSTTLEPMRAQTLCLLSAMEQVCTHVGGGERVSEECEGEWEGEGEGNGDHKRNK